MKKTVKLEILPFTVIAIAREQKKLKIYSKSVYQNMMGF